MKGILFKPDMIKAIVEGRKTQTRRVMQNQPIEMDKAYYKDFRKDAGGWKPRYQVGEVVYIKEAYKVVDVDPLEKDYYPTRVEYRDGETTWVNRPKNIPKIIPDKWHSPMMMPEWAARYFIQITDVKPQGLQEITPEDTVDEGIERIEYGWKPQPNSNKGKPWATSISAYADLWDSINPKYPWASNPWVFAYTFKKVDKPSS